MKGTTQWPVVMEVVKLLGNPLVVQAGAMLLLAAVLAGCADLPGREFTLSGSLLISEPQTTLPQS